MVAKLVSIHHQRIHLTMEDMESMEWAAPRRIFLNSVLSMLSMVKKFLKLW
jgi:hypothetical protein